MSLSQQALRCFANQQTHKPLNAFITSADAYAQKYPDEVWRADERLERGITYRKESFYLFIAERQAVKNLSWMDV